MNTDLFIDGEWRPGADGGRFDVTDPADLSTVARFAIATGRDCMDAVDAAAAAQPGWAATAPRERDETLRAASGQPVSRSASASNRSPNGWNPIFRL